MPYYDFGCACGQVTERRLGYEVAAILCPACGKRAQRRAVYLTTNIVDSAPVPLSDRRYNVSRFKEASEEIDYNHRCEEERRGQELSHPSLYKAGVTRAGIGR